MPRKPEIEVLHIHSLYLTFNIICKVFLDIMNPLRDQLFNTLFTFASNILVAHLQLARVFQDLLDFELFDRQ